MCVAHKCGRDAEAGKFFISLTSNLWESDLSNDDEKKEMTLTGKPLLETQLESCVFLGNPLVISLGVGDPF